MSFGHVQFFCSEFCLDLYPIFFIGLFDKLISSFLSSVYILEISSLSDMELVKIFSHSAVLS